MILLAMGMFLLVLANAAWQRSKVSFWSDDRRDYRAYAVFCLVTSLLLFSGGIVGFWVDYTSYLRGTL